MKRQKGEKKGKTDSTEIPEQVNETQSIKETQEKEQSIDNPINTFVIQTQQQKEMEIEKEIQTENQKEIENIENVENENNNMDNNIIENEIEIEKEKQEKNQIKHVNYFTQEYMSFVHMEIIDDINLLVRDIIESNQQLNYSYFRHMWKKHHMDQELLLERISQQKQESVVNTFFESCLDLFESYQTSQEKLIIIYVLYTAYMTQPQTHIQYRIRLPYDIAKNLFYLPTQENDQQAMAMIHTLITSNAFIYASRKSIISQTNSADIQQNHIVHKLLNEKYQFIPLHSEFKNYSDALKMIQELMEIQNGITDNFFELYNQKLTEMIFQTDNNENDILDEINDLNEIENEEY